MATGPSTPNATNSYTPNLEASGRLITGYSRNVSRFLLPKYVKYVPTKQMQGLFMRLSNQEQARAISAQEYEWVDGQSRPMHLGELEQFAFVPYLTHRYDYGFTVGWLTEQQASWPVVEVHSQIKATQCMTNRTWRMLTVATNTANWTVAGSGDYDLGQDHTATASAFAGGLLDQGAAATPYLKVYMDKAAVLINLETGGAVDQDAIQHIINPNTARKIAESAEFHSFVGNSYWAKEELTNGLQPNNKFGLTSKVYGYNVIVESTVRTTSRKGETVARTYAMPDATVLTIARPGALEGVAGAQDFSTLTWFYFDDEMKIQAFSDPENELTRGHVSENCTEVVTSPLSGFLCTSATS